LSDKISCSDLLRIQTTAKLTTFPYTTLFRSHMKLLLLKGLPASGKSTYAKELVLKGWKRVNKDDLRAMIDNGKWSHSNEDIIKEDRKSTRLNSSHGSISYAVFCLKKKIKKTV